MEKNVDTQSHLSKLVTFHCCVLMSSYNQQLLVQAHKSGSCGTRAGLSIRQKAAHERAAEQPRCSGGRASFSKETSLHLNSIDVLLTQLSCLWLLSLPGMKNPECQYLKQKRSHKLSTNTREILPYSLAEQFVVYGDPWDCF